MQAFLRTAASPVSLHHAVHPTMQNGHSHPSIAFPCSREKANEQRAPQPVEAVSRAWGHAISSHVLQMSGSMPEP